MHNAALSEMGLQDSYRYDIQPTHAHELGSCAEAVRVGSLEGANITIPYKTDIMSYLDDISGEAVKVGSVNTLHRHEDRVKGCNTDVVGFLESLREERVTLKGQRVAILGAGGAARAITHALVQEGVARLDILNRTLVKAEILASRLLNRGSCDVHAWLDATDFDFKATDLLVNCTPIGMKGHSIDETPLRKGDLHNDMVVMDIVYNPQKTRLLREAEQVGCKTIDGTGMLIHQGAAALELWIGKKPPIETMRSAVLKELGGRRID
jgi:shikimate dehydrogenase